MSEVFKKKKKKEQYFNRITRIISNGFYLKELLFIIYYSYSYLLDSNI